MNNIYFVKVKNVLYIAEYIDEFPRYETEDFVEIIIAKTPGKAKSLFYKKYKKEDIEWKDIHILKIASRSEEDPKIVLKEHPLFNIFWEMVDEKINKMKMCRYFR
jgi:hypothetical protein